MIPTGTPDSHYLDQSEAAAIGDVAGTVGGCLVLALIVAVVLRGLFGPDDRPDKRGKR